MQSICANLSIVRRPPVKEGMSLDEIRLIGQSAAALTEDLIKIVECSEVVISDGFVSQRPETFSRLDFRRRGRQKHEFHTFGNLQLAGDMPAGLIEDEDDVLAGCDLPGKGRQDRAESRGVDGVGNEPDHRSRRRSDEAVKIKPRVAVMALGNRAAAARCPDPAQDRLQADPVFVKRPDFNRDRRL